jgi:hypothetical protein
MSKRLAKPESVKTLKDWAARWPRAGNLGFDPETREPAVFDDAGTDRKQISKIPWQREGDTITILAQPERFSEAARAAAASRLGKIREQRTAYETAAADQRRAAESALLGAWRAYHAADSAAKGALRRDVLTAEKAVRDMETALAAQIYVGRQTIMRWEKGVYGFGVYVPPIPNERRGIPITAAAGGGAAASSE